MNTTSIRRPDVTTENPLVLTAKQEAFAVAVAGGATLMEAYEASYTTLGSNRATIRRNAHRVALTPKVAQRIARLRDAAAAGSVRDTAALVADLQAIVDADPAELVRIETTCCRHCHAEAPGAYQWRDETEYARACDVALAKGEPLPDLCGGFGFDPGREPSPICSECNGQGVPRVMFGSTVDASPGARRLLRGVECWPDGTLKRVHFADQLQARIELNRLRGLHVERSVSLNVNANVPALTDAKPEQLLAMLERIRPTVTPAAPAAREPITIDAEPTP